MRDRTLIAGAILGTLFYLGVLAAVIYIGWHFISKWW